MAIYVAAYDLKVKNKDDADVIRAMKSFFTYLHLQESVWLIDSMLSAVDVRDHLSPHLKVGDTLFIGRLTGEWASYHLNQPSKEWLQSPTRRW